MKTKFAVLLLMAALTTGCLPAAIAYTAYEVSNAREKSALTQARASETASYAAYKTEMERVNLDREKAGLKKQEVLALEDWKATLK